MKILFANPPWWVEDVGKPIRRGIRAGSRWPHTVEAHFKPDGWKDGSYAPFPFFLGYAASYLQRAIPEAQVIVRDSVARGESNETFFDFLEDFRPAFIFIESATPSWEHDSGIVEEIKRVLPYTKVVLTGPIAMTDTDKLLKAGAFAVVRGEYEKGSAKAARGQAGLIEHDIMTEKEMNDAPDPMFDEEVALRYWDSNPKGNLAPQLQVWGSRGCHFRCCFCVWPAVMTGNDPDGTKKRTVRFYLPGKIENFIARRREIAREQGKEIAGVYFDDDTGNLTDKHTLGICEVMLRVKLPWTMMCRADTIKPETWQAMADSGCKGGKIGFESGVQRVVDDIVNKRLDIKEAAETCRFIRSLGMTVHGTFTTGLPGESAAESEETKSFIKVLYGTGALDTHQLSSTAEIEGTPLANIKAGESFKAYPGAKKDADYVRRTDGFLNPPTL